MCLCQTKLRAETNNVPDVRLIFALCLHVLRDVSIHWSVAVAHHFISSQSLSCVLLFCCWINITAAWDNTVQCQDYVLKCNFTESACCTDQAQRLSWTDVCVVCVCIYVCACFSLLVCVCVSLYGFIVWINFCLCSILQGLIFLMGTKYKTVCVRVCKCFYLLSVFGKKLYCSTSTLYDLWVGVSLLSIYDTEADSSPLSLATHCYIITNNLIKLLKNQSTPSV